MVFLCARVNNVQEPYQASACPVPNATKQSPSRLPKPPLMSNERNAFPTTPIDRTTATFKYNKDSYFFLLVTTLSKDY